MFVRVLVRVCDREEDERSQMLTVADAAAEDRDADTEDGAGGTRTGS